MSDTVKQNTAEELNDLDDVEAQLLSAMSIDDTEELPVYKACAGSNLSNNASLAEMHDIVEALKTVFDPEIPINIYDLGLIYKIDQQDNGDIHIDMTLTAPGCPVAGILPQQIADAVATIDGVGKVDVEVVWEPAWSIERLSEDAKMMLEML
jgi:FeS assembly SUF system protein